MEKKEELREVMVQTLSDEVKAGREINVLVSDSTSTSKIKPFQQKYPDRVINVGIAEQNLIGIAAGLSLGGIIPITANAAPFLIGRSNEQVKNDICYSQTNVKMIGLNPGFAYGSLGATHHSIDDISVLLGMGNISILAPSDPEETRQIFRYAIRTEGPFYIRLDSIKVPDIHKADYKFVPGQSVFLQQGSDISIIALGTALYDALEAVHNLQQAGISSELISLPSLRPLDTAPLLASLKKTGKVVTVEEHSIHGGIGSITAGIIAKEGITCTLRTLGVPAGSFAGASPREYLKTQYMIDAAGIEATCLKLLKGI